MKKLTNDLMNGYIDNELNQSEIDLVNKIITENPDQLKQLKAHQFVDQGLKKLDVDKAPSNLTQIVMEKISNSISVKNQKPYFLYGVLSVFGIGILSSIIYLALLIPSDKTESLHSRPLFDKVSLFFGNVSSSMNMVFESSNVITIGLALTFVLIIGFLFMLSYQKQVVEKLNSFGH